MEFPINFFLDYAWNPEKWPAEQLPEYTRSWAEEQFGEKYAEDIADILTDYTKFNSRRKPELLSPDTYSLTNYREAERIVMEYNTLAEKAQRIYETIPPEGKDAYYQLVSHPVIACANLNELYVTVRKNRLYAKQGRAATNSLAEKARILFNKDAEITHYYNKMLANGKWNHIMDQTHIGYTYWQQPEKNVMPEVQRIELPGPAEMGIAVQGSEKCWPGANAEAVLPDFDPFNQQTYYIDVFNRGKMPFEFSVDVDYPTHLKEPWIHISSLDGEIETEERLRVKVNWDKAPKGDHRIPITITGSDNSRAVVQTRIYNPLITEHDVEDRFVESNCYISIEAEHYTKAVNTHPITWQRIPDLGRTLSAMTPFPVTAPSRSPAGDSPRLEYRIYLFSKGEVTVKAYLSPTLNFHNNQGLRYGISFDTENPQIINIHSGKTFQDWEESVSNNITVEVSKHTIRESGKHVLKIWAVDPGVVLQKLVVETGEVAPSYLGPPESFNSAKLPVGALNVHK